MTNSQQLETAYFGGGCFWCTEAIFQRLKGVTTVVSGYTGGTTPNPDYAQVSTGTTGHVEAIRIDFDPSQISYSDLVDIFFATHDPTTPNQQGADIGSQYRSAIFYTTSDQEKIARSKMLSEYVTQIAPLNKFYPAENYHQNYFNSHPDKPYCQLVIAPKLTSLLTKFTRYAIV